MCISLSLPISVCVSLSASHSLASHISPPASPRQWNQWKSRLIKQPKWFSALKPRKPHLQIQRKQVRLVYFLSSLPYSLILYSLVFYSTQFYSSLFYSFYYFRLLCIHILYNSIQIDSLLCCVPPCCAAVLGFCQTYFVSHAADFICTWSLYTLNLIWSLSPKSYLELQWRPVLSFQIAN